MKGLLNPGEQGIVVRLGGFSKGAMAVERASANISLIDGKRFVSLFLDHYHSLDPTWRTRCPLRVVFVPIRN